MSAQEPIRVVAVGSAHGDDAVGWHVIEELRSSLNDSSQIEAHRVDGGQRLLDLLDGRGVLLLIDAVQTGGIPGTVHCLTWPDPRIESLRPGSTHEVSLAEGLRLAETLGSVPQRVIVFGVEIAQPCPLPGLSAQALAAIPEVVAAITREVDQLRLAVAGKDRVSHA